MFFHATSPDCSTVSVAVMLGLEAGSKHVCIGSMLTQRNAGKHLLSTAFSYLGVPDSDILLARYWVIRLSLDLDMP